MKLKMTLSTLALAIVAMCQVYLLSKIPQSMAIGNRVRTCSPLTCGGLWNDIIPRRAYRRSMFDQFNELFYALEDDYNRHLSHLSSYAQGPKYEIREDDSKMELVLEVPGVHASYINIQLEKGGKLLKVNGSRIIHYQGTERTTNFEKTFTVDPKSVDINELKANMEDGILVITAPKLPKEVEETVRVVPISFKDVDKSKDIPDLIVEETLDDSTQNQQDDTDDLEITEEDV